MSNNPTLEHYQETVKLRLGLLSLSEELSRQEILGIEHCWLSGTDPINCAGMIVRMREQTSHAHQQVAES